MKPHILLVEDESGQATKVRDVLSRSGYVIQTARDAETALAAAFSRRYDAILLDSRLQGKSGFDVCRELRRQGIDTALMLFTPRGQVRDRVQGLRLGADDCLSKPFDPAELLARLEALLRRTMRAQRAPDSTFRFGAVEIDFARSEVMREGREVKLAGKELELLRYLITNQERVVPREELMTRVWDYASDASSRTVDTHVVWLRHKLEADPQTPRHIQTVRGRGYRFTA